jgi:hypothetical protein
MLQFKRLITRLTSYNSVLKFQVMQRELLSAHVSPMICLTGIDP